MALTHTATFQKTGENRKGKSESKTNPFYIGPCRRHRLEFTLPALLTSPRAVYLLRDFRRGTFHGAVQRSAGPNAFRESRTIFLLCKPFFGREGSERHFSRSYACVVCNRGCLPVPTVTGRIKTTGSGINRSPLRIRQYYPKSFCAISFATGFSTPYWSKTTISFRPCFSRGPGI